MYVCCMMYILKYRVKNKKARIIFEDICFKAKQKDKYGKCK